MRQQGFGQQRRRHPFAARNQEIQRAWLEVSEDRDCSAEIAVLPRRLIDLREQRSAFSAGWQQCFYRETVTLKKCRRARRRVVDRSCRRVLSTAKQEVGNSGQRGRDDDERAVM